jgi:hypothetical protein
VTRLKWKLILFRLETVLILPQDRYTVCAICAIGSEIILDVPGGTPRDKAQVEARLSTFGDSANLDTR